MILALSLTLLLSSQIPLSLEHAKTPHELTRGLMGRTELGSSRGMLFHLPYADHWNFWSKGCLMRLSIAFLDSQGQILEIQELPMDQGKTTLTSSQLSTYALEMESGWFEEHDVRVGDRVVWEGNSGGKVLKNRDLKR